MIGYAHLIPILSDESLFFYEFDIQLVIGTTLIPLVSLSMFLSINVDTLQLFMNSLYQSVCGNYWKII